MELDAKHLYKEKIYQRVFCNKFNGEVEYVLSDKTRVDCLTSLYAIEVDFANKWAESIGQSLYYGMMTERQSGVLLIIEQDTLNLKYLKRLKLVADEVDIVIWTINKKMVIKRIK